MALNDVVDTLTFHGFYEVKKLSVEELELNGSRVCDDVFIAITVGSKGDEGTLAEVLFRDHYMFFIGPRGGLYVHGDNGRRRRFKAHESLNACEKI